MILRTSLKNCSLTCGLGTNNIVNRLFSTTTTSLKCPDSSTSTTTTTSTSTLSSLTTVDDDKDGVRWITLNNPSKRNVLSLDMLRSISSRIEDVRNDVRCIVLKSNGPVFSAGHDLEELASNRNVRQQVFSTASKLMIRLQRDIPVPVVAQVSGPAVAAGVQLITSCDIVVASRCSTFSTPGVNVGVFCTTPGVAVGRSTNVKTAAFMLLTGKAISADDAVRSGLITLSCPIEQLNEVTNSIISSLVSKSRSVLELGKRSFYRQMSRSNIYDAYTFAESIMCQNLDHPDAREGIRAFTSKEKPKWSHEPLHQ